MKNEEFELSLHAFNARRPFRAYLVEFVSGDQILVHHPEAIAYLKKLWLYRGPRQAQALFSSASVCRVLDVPSAEER